MSLIFPPYPCTGAENPGDARILHADGSLLNTIKTSRCHADWYCEFLRVNSETGEVFTWEWQSGIDPDDPSTWPEEPAPQDPTTAP